jgi:hypothetical protein
MIDKIIGFIWSRIPLKHKEKFFDNLIEKGKYRISKIEWLRKIFADIEQLEQEKNAVDALINSLLKTRFSQDKSFAELIIMMFEDKNYNSFFEKINNECGINYGKFVNEFTVFFEKDFIPWLERRNQSPLEKVSIEKYPEKAFYAKAFEILSTPNYIDKIADNELECKILKKYLLMMRESFLL